MIDTLKILNTFNTCYSRDEKIVNTLIQRIKSHYTKNYATTPQETGKEIHIQSYRSGFGPIKTKFESNFNCSIPWIDGKVWNVIKQRNGQSLPSTIKCGKVTFTNGTEILARNRSQRRQWNEEVKRSDRQCWETYTRRERWLSISQRNSFARAGIQAARELGVLQELHGRNLSFEDRINECVQNTSKDSNSCYPLFGRKNSDRCLKDTEHWLNKLFKNPNGYTIFKNPILIMPTSILYRTQPSVKEDSSVEIKIRQVWGQPQRIIALESFYFSHIFENVKLNNISGKSPIYSSGLSDHEISIKMVSRLKNMIDPNDKSSALYSMDYSKYDRTIPSFASDLFYSICKEVIPMDKNEEKIYDLLRLYSKFTPFSYGNKVYFKRRGISSGSYLTNLLDTWFNLTLWILSRNMVDVFLKHDIGLNYDSENILNSPEFKNLHISSYFVRNVCLCGDDVIIYTKHLDVLMHKTICLAIDMNIEPNVIISDKRKYTYFLGRYWDEYSKPKQSSVYMTSHIVVRTKWYNPLKVDPHIIENVCVMRILSICLVLENGLDYLKKTFSDYPPFIKFMNNQSGFRLLKEWPNEEYIFVNFKDSLSWKNISRLTSTNKTK